MIGNYNLRPCAWCLKTSPVKTLRSAWTTRDDVTAAEIEAAMDLVIARNIFSSSGGDLVSKQDIRIIDSTTNDLYDPPIQ